jgi:hypothetical protein
MEHLLPEFDVYDLLAYFIPGGTISFFIYLILKNCNFNFQISLENLTLQILASFLIIIVIFVIGFLIQCCGSTIESNLVYKKRKHFGQQYPSIRFMEEEDTHYPKSFKNKIKKSLKRLLDCLKTIQFKRLSIYAILT